MAVCSMLCTDGLLLHLVGKRQLLVYSGASYSNGKFGDSIRESHHKSSAQGARRACAWQTLPQRQQLLPAACHPRPCWISLIVQLEAPVA